jgi:DNA-directed RNA polymerase subunit RPC12/RpoP
VTNFCIKCGKALSLLQRLGSSHCPDCQAEIDLQDAEEQRVAKEKAATEERQATQKRYDAASQGVASEDELLLLAAEGYLIAAGRLIQCPICGHDRFRQQRTLMNTRAMTFLNFDWADSGADTRICQRCSYVLWFAR